LKRIALLAEGLDSERGPGVSLGAPQPFLGAEVQRERVAVGRTRSAAVVVRQNRGEFGGSTRRERSDQEKRDEDAGWKKRPLGKHLVRTS
jgi:hypothetical protein